MNIIIQGEKLHAQTIEKKVQTLDRYCSALKDMMVEVVYDHHHKKGNVVSVQLIAHLLCHGNLPLRTSQTGSDLHEAVDNAVQTMKHLLISHKDKEEHVDRDTIRKASGKS